ncbi:sulfite exporter TauE/SafE family protein [Thiomicrorhabdus sp. zzn3]|uniref:sulfite exporter TauE/SafE family protein n=1 Tax=Thiomicrorhabdus sp. zzn3 TaxID=3039775 RepID=UPI0024374052|nr:sulfite exporter TauE/SafE family protein [Thiomicrorhabdus sp. zzn3]MDG6778954.1 sulfite exporter TauE/SafE family protein [Thiomicrorhabdus sp. zzn3]
MESIWITAVIVGLLGGVHCLGMCGGVVGALTFSLDPRVQRSWPNMLLYQLAYNGGRIFSYMLIGSLFGFLGMALGSLAALLPAQQLLQILAGFFMLALGLYLAGWWNGVVVVEKLGKRLWAKMQPYAQRLTPVRSLPQAWWYGMVWGWLPCGLVYSMLIMALSAGGAVEGALVMLAFGLGTLPNLMLMGVFAFYFTRLARQKWLRIMAGLGVMALGFWQFYLALTLQVGH